MTAERELWVPVDRLQPIVAHYKGTKDSLTPNMTRRLHLIETGSQDFVSLSVVDRLLIEMDLDCWLRLDRDQGGLADIYQDGAQYGCPARPSKYSSVEERLEARRRQWRESKQTRREAA